MPISIRQAQELVPAMPTSDEGEELFYLYRHIRLDTNQVFYVGIGKKPSWRVITGPGVEYCRAFEKANRKRHWKNIVNKVKYRVDILLESCSHSFIKQKEVEFIKLYGRRDLGLGSLVNYTNGGEGSEHRIQSSETRLKISLGHKGKIYTLERRQMCARKNQIVTEETRLKMRNTHLLRNQKLRECQLQ